MRLPTSILYIVTVLIWGTSWYAMEYQIVIPFELAILYRFALATAMLVGYCLITGRSLRFSRRDHLFMAAQGFFLFGINYVLFYWAAAYLISGLLAVCFSTLIVMNLVNGALFFRQPIDRPRGAGGGAGHRRHLPGLLAGDRRRRDFSQRGRPRPGPVAARHLCRVARQYGDGAPQAGAGIPVRRGQRHRHGLWRAVRPAARAGARHSLRASRPTPAIWSRCSISRCSRRSSASAPI